MAKLSQAERDAMRAEIAADRATPRAKQNDGPKAAAPKAAAPAARKASMSAEDQVNEQYTRPNQYLKPPATARQPTVGGVGHPNQHTDHMN